MQNLSVSASNRSRSLSTVRSISNSARSPRKLLSKVSLNHSTGLQVAKEAKVDAETLILTHSNPNNKPISNDIFLKSQIEVAVSTKNKKKPNFKVKDVILFTDRIEIIGQSRIKTIPLNCLCMLQQEEVLKNSLNMSMSSPFVGRLSNSRKERGEKTILLCTHDLSRIFFCMSSKKELQQWMLAIDGLLTTLFQSSLLDPNLKVGYLRESCLIPFGGGSIKVGDDEEWTYFSPSGELHCTFSTDERMKNAKFVFDGQFIRPHYEYLSSPGNGEWDGMNLYWYNDDIQGGVTERKRRKNALIAYNWNELLLEFRLIVPEEIISYEADNTFKFARTFLARKNSDGSGWLQLEGEVPICLMMFLYIFRSQIPKAKSITIEDEDKEKEKEEEKEQEKEKEKEKGKKKKKEKKEKRDKSYS